MNNSNPPNSILVVSHGGWIMEFLNVIRETKRQPPLYQNKSKNTALYMYRIRKKGQTFSVTSVIQNDISHLN